MKTRAERVERLAQIMSESGEKCNYWANHGLMRIYFNDYVDGSLGHKVYLDWPDGKGINEPDLMLETGIGISLATLPRWRLRRSFGDNPAAKFGTREYIRNSIWSAFSRAVIQEAAEMKELEERGSGE